MKIEIEINDESAALIEELLARPSRNEATSHGALTIKLLAELLLDDVALTQRRPGSWEGANMLQVLQGHGYCQGKGHQSLLTTCAKSADVPCHRIRRNPTLVLNTTSQEEISLFLSFARSVDSHT